MIAEFAAQASLAYAFVEREVALMKRYWLWEVVWIIYGIVTSLSVAFIGIAAPAISGNAVDPATTSRFVLYLLVGTIAWRFMGLVFENIAEIIAWERWEGTIEYTFMAPVPRLTHLAGMAGGTIVRAVVFSVTTLFAVM
ncbi:MAG TPA: ABC transporter permease, partial [Candidatus Limnocylindria bacterium]